MKLGKSRLRVSRLGLGCMRMAQLTVEEASQVIQTCLALGINFFDHADIYGGGQAERVFGQAIKLLGLNRDEIVIQSKCGIRKGYYDFSKDHILASVEGILERLQVDYLDVLLLHRPDALMEPAEVAAAFRELKLAKKVKHFGVSNFNTSQIELLQHFWEEPLLVNQLQFGLAHTPLIDAGLHVNMLEQGSFLHDSGVVDYCRLHQMTIQTWSPFLIDLAQGVFATNEAYSELNQAIHKLALEKGVADEAITIAWILRHPAKMQPIVGSMNPSRLANIAQALKVELTRPEWYDLYQKAGNSLP